MLRRIFNRHSYVMAWITLGIIAILAWVAIFALGFRFGGLVALILFATLDGLGSVWEVATYSSRERIGRKLDRQENDALVNGSKDNPTIR